MIPTYKQYKKWSLPSKYAFWGIVISLVGLIVTLIPSKEDKSVLEAIAEEEYKPNVSIMKVEAIRWAGDKEKFLTIYFINESKGPAINFGVELYKGNEKLEFSKSDSTRVLYSGNLAIGANRDIGLALAPLSEFKNFLKRNNVLGELVGFGVGSEVPRQIVDSMYDKYVTDGNGSYSIESYPIFVKYTYNGITDLSGEVVTGIYAYIDKNG
ncbi:hypothetical protein [Vibrio coralliilyticus]|uniref:hypothetical protein n=1 Tax=Vibrio coralliilyticus TaxID=190893 RepID=UPI001E4EF478|nr:hypothetical protein [Vibrio coralliilyticus]MCC2524312.1 hypothetical protein [Vibrio coralliilyticus]